MSKSSSDFQNYQCVNRMYIRKLDVYTHYVHIHEKEMYKHRFNDYVAL